MNPSNDAGSLDIVHRIRDFNAGREPERLELKYRAMRESAFAFLRGTCHLFYERLARTGPVQTTPRVWASGDLHLENFGSYKADNGLVCFDINDFDEAALAPASWELLRLLTSVWVAGGELGLGDEPAGALGRALIEAYAGALAAGKALWIERDTARGPVRALLDGLRERTRVDFLDGRTKLRGRQRVLRTDGKHALPASEAERTAVTDFAHRFARAQPDADFFEVLDVARRIAGTGSLGVPRYVILVRGKGSPDGNYLLDLKQALPSSMAAHLGVAQPDWATQAHRVVDLQRRVQAVPMAFLQPVTFQQRGHVLRGLQPSEDRITLARHGRAVAHLAQLMGDLGRIAAWGQLRSAGHAGSAATEELIAFGRTKLWWPALLDLSRDCAEQVRRDAASFNEAFDDGALQD